MVVEYIRYSIPAERRREFESAYDDAGGPLEASAHCRSYEVTRCVEDAASYVVRIEWDSIEGHESGFRKSPEFQEFFAGVRPFVGDIEEMRHYELVTPASA